ncbi:unnamed protein product, partial [Ectocarpus sp. 12 AP-2014]
TITFFRLKPTANKHVSVCPGETKSEGLETNAPGAVLARNGLCVFLVNPATMVSASKCSIFSNRFWRSLGRYQRTFGILCIVLRQDVLNLVSLRTALARYRP